MSLKTEVEKIVKEFDDKHLLSETETKERAIEEAVAEIVASIEDFDLWYWDDYDYRQVRLPEVGVEEPKSLFEAIGKVYDENEKQAAEDAEPFPNEAIKDVVVGRLVGMVVDWEKWYYDHKVRYDQEEWLDSASENAEIYEYSDYGDPEKSEGLGGLYVDENMPFETIEGAEIELLEAGI